MEIKLIARTYECNNINKESSGLHELDILGGKLAGICYMPDDYTSKAIQNIDKALSKAEITRKSGHHSVFDHGSITLLIEGIPKITAMLLNSLEVYSTSEKSARYTVMKPETELENEMYKKWINIFTDKINQTYKIDEKTVSKLAHENARYLISVFTPTVMAYTTSYRQLNYIVDWCEKLVKSLEVLDGEFNKRLYSSVQLLKEKIINVLGEKKLSDLKNRYFEFMPFQHGLTLVGHKNIITDVYSVEYKISLAGLAQAHRHRTLHYQMLFKGVDANEYGFYVPKIIEDDVELKAEWLDDINKVSYCYPQGTLVSVIEQGQASDFFLKCKERLCGRAQLEIMINTLQTLILFKNNGCSLSSINKYTLNQITLEERFVPKCGFDGYSCVEKCMWGVSKGLTRKI